MIAIDMIEACAPNVAPATIQHIIRVESGGDPLAININGGIRLPRKPRDAADAAALVKQILATAGRGVSVDMGLMQVNSNNLAKLGYTVEEMFSPCTNITAGAAVLSNFYRLASLNHGHGQPALMAALSAYNTGSFTRGFRNGYVARYTQVRTARQSAAVQAIDPFEADSAVYIRQEKTMMPNDQKQDPAVISRNINDAAIPGVQVEVDADVAEQLGAFQESALSDADAWDANADLDDAETTPAAVERGQAANVVSLHGKSNVKKGGAHE